MSDWWSKDPVTRAQEMGKDLDKPKIQIWQKLKQWVEKLFTEKPEKIKDKRSVDEVVEDAAAYLREKKGDLENVTDAEIQEATEQAVEGLPIKPKGGDTLLTEDAEGSKPERTGEEPENREPEAYNETVKTLLSEDSGYENIGPKKIGNKEAEQIGGVAGQKAQEQGLYLWGEDWTSIVDKDGNKWFWDGDKWVKSSSKVSLSTSGNMTLLS